MTGEEILNLTRDDLEDTEEEYLWKTSYLVTCLNRTLNEIYEKTDIFTDFSTSAICQIEVLSGLALYSLDPRVLTVQSPKLSSQSVPLTKVHESELNDYRPGWREKTGTPTHYVPEAEPQKILLYPFYDATGVMTGASNISFISATPKITKPSGLSVYAVGDKVNVSGTTNNNKTVTVTGVLDTELTVSETLVDEANTSAVLRKVRDTLDLTVSRLQLTPFTVANLNTLSPEISFQYHDRLPHGVKKYAYLKRDSQTLDPKASAAEDLELQRLIEDIKRDLLKKKARYNSTVGPRRGAI